MRDHAVSRRSKDDLRRMCRAGPEVRRYYASFSYRAGSWTMPRCVVAKVEWHPGELYPRVGFIVTNMTRPAARAVTFYNQRGTAEQWIKEGKNAVAWTRLSCHRFAANAVRLQLHALAYNMANFLRTPAVPDEVKQWSLTTLRERLVKVGAKIVRLGRLVTFQRPRSWCRASCSSRSWPLSRHYDHRRRQDADHLQSGGNIRVVEE
jgi:hypothetical protein